MDIRQFAYAGIDVYGILAETTGKNVEELKKMDITYEELSKALQTASQEGGKYYNGQAQSVETLNGQVSRLKKSFQELLGELAQSLMPTIKSITKSIQNLANKFSNLTDSQKKTIANIGLFVTALGPALIIIGKIISSGGTVFKILSSLIGSIAKLSAGTGMLTKVFTAITGPIGIIIATLTSLIAIFVRLYQTNESFRLKVNETFNGIVQLIQNHIMPVLTTFGELVGNVLNEVFEILKKAWETIEPFVQQIFEILMKLWNGFGKDIVGAIGDMLAWLLDKLNWLNVNIISPIVDFLVNVLLAKITIVIGTITSIVSGLTDIITSVWSGIKTTLEGIIEFITGVFSGSWEQAWQGVADIFNGIWEGLTGVVKGVVNIIIGALNTFIDGINKISFDVPDWVPGIGGQKWGFNIPKIPELASGGIVDKATLAMIGEGKSPEAVIPLDRTLTRYMAEALKEAGMGNIVVNFYPQQMTEAEMNNAFNYINKRFGLAY